MRDALNNFVLSNLHAVVSKGYLAIPEKYGKLVTSPRTAWSLKLSLAVSESDSESDPALAKLVNNPPTNIANTLPSLPATIFC